MSFRCDLHFASDRLSRCREKPEHASFLLLQLWRNFIWSSTLPLRRLRNQLPTSMQQFANIAEPVTHPGRPLVTNTRVSVYIRSLLR